MKKSRMAAALVGLALVAACGREEPTEGLVARAGKYRLSVEDAVPLLVDQESLPNNVDVVRALADLWADYTLLAAEAAEDSTLESLNLEPLVRQQLQQEMIFQLRDSVIRPDTAISDADLLAAYQREAPGSQVHASHILMTFPENPTPAQRDSVRAAIEGVRARALAGESFEALARQFSQDPGTAKLGGDLGTFGKGDMVRPFEEAAFALQPGGISDVVETPYGLHVIRLNSREAPGFDQVKEEFRVGLIRQRYMQAESSFVAGVQERGNPVVDKGAENVVREIAKDPSARMSRSASRKALVSFKGGAVTVEEYRTVLYSQQPQFRAQVESATDEQIDNFLKGLAQRDLLVLEAEQRGLAPSKARVDSLVSEARMQLRTVTADIGFHPLERAPDEKLQPAVARAVRKALTDVLTGAKDVVPLGLLAFQLREGTPVSVFDAGLGEVVLKVGQLRAGRGLSASDSAAGADTAGR